MKDNRQRTFLRTWMLLTLAVGPAYVFGQSAITADEALIKLKAGNERYVSDKPDRAHLNQSRRTETSTKGQFPYATIIGCSDSRVPVEYIFDAGIGDLFIIRVAGNVVATDEAGSIEYGVDHLHTPLFVVLGHSDCGAVKAVVKNAEVHGNIPALVDNIGPAVEKARDSYGDDFSEQLLEAAIENNVWQSIEDLIKISPVTTNLLKEGKLKIVGALYDLNDGKVEWLGEHPTQTELITKYAKTEHGH